MRGSLTFAVHWHPLLVGAVSTLMVLCIGVGVLTCARTRWRPAAVCAEGLRLLLLLALVVTLAQPEFRRWIDRHRKPSIDVIEDQTRSMETQDVVDGETTISRREQVESIRSSTEWERISEAIEVQWKRLGDRETGGTNLQEALMRARDQRPSAVIVLSDGDWNEGGPPEEAATAYRSQGVPILVVPVGQPNSMPDLEIAQWSLPVNAALGEPVRIPVMLRNRFERPVDTVLSLDVDGTRVEERPLTLKAGSDEEEVFFWRAEKAGAFEISVRIRPVADEVSEENNAKKGRIIVSDQKLKVLVVESVPRWEYRYLRNALMRDPGVEVHCVLMHPGAGMGRGAGAGYLNRFPATQGELSDFDVVFLGDVGVSVNGPSDEDLNRLRVLIEEQSAGLVFLPGPRGAFTRLMDSPIEPLIPVTLDPGKPEGVGSAVPFSMVLTASAHLNPITMLEDSPEESRMVWQRFAGLHWHAPVLRRKAGAQVLAVHESATNAWGRLPLLVTRSAGRGKVLFLGTDGAWRWRRGVEDRYHYRFWGQVVRWMAYQRKLAEGERARLLYTPDRPMAEEPVMVTATIMGEDKGPLTDSQVILRAKSETAEESWVFTKNEMEWGTFSSTIQFREGGRYDLKLETVGGEAIDYEASMAVAVKPAEPFGEPSRPEVLAALARGTGGNVYRADELDALAERLMSLSLEGRREEIVELWNHPVWIAFVIGLFGAYWLMRKRASLI